MRPWADILVWGLNKTCCYEVLTRHSILNKTYATISSLRAYYHTCVTLPARHTPPNTTIPKNCTRLLWMPLVQQRHRKKLFERENSLVKSQDFFLSEKIKRLMFFFSFLSKDPLLSFLFDLISFLGSKVTYIGSIFFFEEIRGFVKCGLVFSWLR